jgi:hypothetical protein
MHSIQLPELPGPCEKNINRNLVITLTPLYVEGLMLIGTKLLEDAVQSKVAPPQIVYAVSFYHFMLEA